MACKNAICTKGRRENKMKKIICSVLAVGILLLVSVCVSAENEKRAWRIEVSDVDGIVSSCELLETDSGSLLIPLRFLLESLGATVTWHPENGDISVDFGNENWMIKNIEGTDSNDYFYLVNLQITDEQSGEIGGYSDFSGCSIEYKKIPFLHPPELINDVNYIYLWDAEEIARTFRSIIEVDESEKTVEFFIRPKPFYLGDAYKKNETDIIRVDGRTAKAGCLVFKNEIMAISLEDLITAMGGEAVSDYVSEYIEGIECVPGYNNEFYETYRVNGNLLLFSYTKDSSEYKIIEGSGGVGLFLYNMMNVDEETEDTICRVVQKPEYTFGREYGTGYMADGKLYIGKNNIKYMMQYCGYELREGNMQVVRISNELDKSLHRVIYKG